MHCSYRKGNILSLKLRNFQTYSEIKFNFGPNLNFIAGPNGSGKSSIANALVFVFGGTPKTIGKSKNISDYIKFDTVDGYVEAVIKISDEEVCTVKRTIRAHSNTSNWFKNNIPVTKIEIQSLVQSLNINVDNLCQFLPQEKVSEFSRLSPEELLQETLETSTDKIIISKKENLKFLENNLIKIENNIDVVDKRKEGIEKVMNDMKRDVEKFVEKEKMEEKIKLMKIKKEWIIFEINQKNYTEIGNKIKVLKEKIEEENENLIEINRAIEEEQNDSQFINFDGKLVDFKNRNNKLDCKIKNISSKKQTKDLIEIDKVSLEKKINSRNSELKNLTKKIEDLKNKLNKISIPKPIEINENDKNKIDELEEELSNLKREMMKIQNESVEISKEIEDLTSKRNLLTESDSRKLEQLKKYHYDTYQAVVWLRANKNIFKDEIIEPPFLHINLKDLKYSQEVEMFLNFSILSTFICKNFEDFEKLTSFLKDEKKLKINVFEKITSESKSKYTLEEIKNLGFDGYLIDFIETRNEIKEFINIMGHFNEIPIAKKSLNENAIFKTHDFKRMIINKSYFEIKRSKYNSEDFIIIQNRISSKNFFDTKLPQQEISEIEKILKSKDLKRKDNRIQYKIIMEKINEKDDFLNDLYSKRSEYKARLMEIENITEQKKYLSNNIKDLEIEFKKLSDFSKYEIEEQEIKEKIKLINIEIQNSISEVVKNVKEENFYEFFSDLYFQHQEIKQKELKILSEKQKLKEINISIEEYNDLLKKFISSKSELKSVLKKSKKEILENKLSPLQTQVLNKLPDKIENLDKEIASESAKLTFFNIDTEFIKDFTSKENILNEINLKKSNFENEKRSVQIKIDSLKNDLIIKIQEIIKPINEKFQYFFKKINCEGKIEFHEKDLFSSKWGINILVKFRENENFEILSSFRQSGGEKSVTTILFLLSLQETSPAPFRLVDEINQGMDRYNEKLVHDILLEISEQPNSPQFFIITPKIVPDLSFSRNMKVIIVYAGMFENLERIFENYKHNEHMLLQLLDCLEKSKEISTRRAAILKVENNNKTHLALIKGFLKVKYRWVEEVTKKSLEEAQLAKLYNEIEKRKLHSKLYNARKNELVSVSDSSRWLKRGNIRSRNEAVFCYI
ncbi:structural maintenance of chromosomes protein 5, partial [Hamiltosporidium magnivora]